MAHRIMNKDLKAAKHLTFEVFKRNGRLKPHLKRAFLEQKYLDYADVYDKKVCIKDGSEWHLVVDQELADFIHASFNPIPCILSCQEDWQGNKIAVVRLYKEKEGQNGINLS